jgi:hypothetical protein
VSGSASFTVMSPQSCQEGQTANKCHQLVSFGFPVSPAFGTQ